MKSSTMWKFAAKTCYSLISPLKFFYMNKTILEESIFTFWEWEFLLFTNFQKMFILWKLQNEFECFSHTIFDKFFFCFFEFWKFFDEFLDNLMLCVVTEAFTKLFEKIVTKVIWMLHQKSDNLPGIGSNLLEFLAGKRLLQLSLCIVYLWI